MIRTTISTPNMVLQGEHVWNLWSSLGSISKVKNALANEQGQERWANYSDAHLYYLAKRYLLTTAIQDRAKAKELLQVALRVDAEKNGGEYPAKDLSEEDFDVALVRLAITAMRTRPTQFFSVIERLGLEKYRFMWEFDDGSTIVRRPKDPSRVKPERITSGLDTK